MYLLMLHGVHKNNTDRLKFKTSNSPTIQALYDCKFGTILTTRQPIN